jgi:RNA polymerase sigma factor (sigma-70 family)
MPDVSAGQSPTGDEEARFELLYVVYGRRVRSYVAARLGRKDFHLAEDLAQETWLEVWRSLASLRAADDAAFGWLAVIARRVISRHFRRHRNVCETPTDYTGPAVRLLPTAPAAEDIAVARETARCLGAVA